MPVLSSLPKVNRNTLLIVGNGLNRAVDTSGGWDKLLATLIHESGYDSVLKTPSDKLSSYTNFVTLYQEIALHWMRAGKDEIDLKTIVADVIEEFEESVLYKCDLHEQLVSLPCQNICTTNYDYVLDKCASEFGDIEDCDGSDSETIYSLFRCVAVEGTTIWHIHGEAGRPKSINLGHTQYGGYLHYARQYLIKGMNSNDKKIYATLNQKLDGTEAFDDDCWLDLFFSSHKIIWLGIGLPPAEYVLWWLIFYRAEKAQHYKTFYRGHEMHYIDIYDPNDEKQRPDAWWQRAERNRMLRTSGVIVHERPISSLKGWAQAYADVIQELGK